MYYLKVSYPKAHLVQIEIAELTKKEQEAFEIEKGKKLQIEIDNLRKRQQNETQALELKIQNNYNEFKRNRALAIESLLLKYKNKFRELDNAQKQEIVNLEKIAKEAEKGNSMINI